MKNHNENLNCLHAEKLANLEIWNGKLSDANYKLMVENEELRDAAEDAKYWKQTALDLAKLIQKDGNKKEGVVSSEMYFKADIVLANAARNQFDIAPDSEVAEKGSKVAEDSKNSVKMSLNDGLGKVMKFTVGKSYPMRNGRMAKFEGEIKHYYYPLRFTSKPELPDIGHTKNGQWFVGEKHTFDIMQGDEPEDKEPPAVRRLFHGQDCLEPEDTAIERGLDKMVERDIKPKAGEWWLHEDGGKVRLDEWDDDAWICSWLGYYGLNERAVRIPQKHLTRRLAPHEIPVIAPSQEGDRKRYCLGDMWVVWIRYDADSLTENRIGKSSYFSTLDDAKKHVRFLNGAEECEWGDIRAIAITRADATEFFEGEGL